jgi:MraZ protein
VPEPLFGQHRYRLDPKGRISLPERFREAFADGVYLTLGQDGCLIAFPRDEWERQQARLAELPLSDPRARAFERFFMANSAQMDLDGQGRVVIPQALRQKAGLGGEVSVNGAGRRLEIWDVAAWERYSAAFEAQYASGSLVPE